MRCVIFTACGEIANTVKALEISADDLVIAADNGYTKAISSGVQPDILVGDLDSFEGRLPDNIILIKSSPVKDDTDTLMAIKEGFRRGYRDFVLVGGLGGRLDHTFANLQCLKYIVLEGGKAQILDDSTRCTVIRNDTVTVSAGYRYCSVFSMGETAFGVTFKGFKYPLTDATVKDSFPIGVSNEILSSQAEITVENGFLLIIQN